MWGQGVSLCFSEYISVCICGSLPDCGLKLIITHLENLNLFSYFLSTGFRQPFRLFISLLCSESCLFKEGSRASLRLCYWLRNLWPLTWLTQKCTNWQQLSLRPFLKDIFGCQQLSYLSLWCRYPWKVWSRALCRTVFLIRILLDFSPVPPVLQCVCSTLTCTIESN